MTNMTKSSEPKNVVIIGAGPVGLVIAWTLARRKDLQGNPLYNVHVFERRPDPRTTRHADEAYSFNIMLSSRGIKTIREAGLLDSFVREGAACKQLLFCIGGDDVKNGLFWEFDPVFGTGDHYIAMSRDTMMCTVLEEMETISEKNIHVLFNASCNLFDFENANIHVATNGVEKVYHYDLLIGADGTFPFTCSR
ncbi:hypothetical protein BC938DRAFT_475574 [Jimgerdemannia flammicorona]|uniref:Uncharacterized protein n=1 Tax=Jimgerdemannia flammicorona TaxID=994334 RepID=A0A433QRK0_9FUNG|nr:hypothetical protein BC938DRAFT_475574 [Jimgerdemannia flammicorona]